MTNTTKRQVINSFPRRNALTRRFTLGAPRSWSVSADGSSVLFLRSSGPLDSENSLWLARRGETEPQLILDPVAAAGHRPDSLDDAEKARRERTREQAGGVVTYAARSDLSEVVLVLAGQIGRVVTADGSLAWLQASDDVFDPRLRPDGGEVVYVSGRGLRLSSARGDSPIPGTLDESANVSWGSAEFVAAEEMGRGRGFWWEPEGGRLAATRVDTSPVEEWWIASPEDPAQAPRAIRYPAAGMANAAVELWVVDPDAGPTVQIDWRREEFEYLADVRWGDRLLCTVQTRDQRVTAILAVDPDTGTSSELQRSVDDNWTELIANSPSVGAHGLMTVVDSDGARRLALDGLPVTGADFQLRSLLGSDDDSIYVTVSTDAINSVLARVRPDGSTEFLSDSHAYVSGVGGAGTLCLSTATATAASTHEIRWNDGTVTPIESFAAEPGFGREPHFHVVGDRALNVVLCLPDEHDGSKLPVLLDPYGGPHAQRVLRVRNAFSTSQWFAEQGFAVVVIDGRGTPGRGPAFEREVWGDLAQPVLDDQVDGLLALAERRPELDLDRVAIRGWSFGGYLAALAVLRRPDVFHAAVAGAPVTDWHLYDTHYTERYLGHPDDHPLHYERTSLLVDAHLLERPLMLIHGLADDNVVSAHTLNLSSALLAAGRAHQVLPLSGVSHMTPQEQVAENLLHLQLDFLRQALGIETGA